MREVLHRPAEAVVVEHPPDERAHTCVLRQGSRGVEHMLRGPLRRGFVEGRALLCVLLPFPDDIAGMEGLDKLRDQLVHAVPPPYGAIFRIESDVLDARRCQLAAVDERSALRLWADHLSGGGNARVVQEVARPETRPAGDVALHQIQALPDEDVQERLEVVGEGDVVLAVMLPIDRHERPCPLHLKLAKISGDARG